MQDELLVKLFDPSAGDCTVSTESTYSDVARSPWVIVGEAPEFPAMNWNEDEDED